MTETSRLSTGAVVLLVVAALVAVPLLTMGGGMMGFGGAGLFGGGMVLGPLLLVGLGVLVYYAASKGDEPTSPDAALETLRERYARGELSDEEFEKRKRTLESRRD